MNFNSFDLNPTILANVLTVGYETPTPIQSQSIPSILLGKDVMGLAQTGTGKTAAFVLPILDRLMKGPRSCLRALIVAPTRELAQQIHESIVALARNTKLRSVTVYGGVNINPQIQGIAHGAEIIVACPGRLLDIINQGAVNLSKVEVLVLDEADHMFDMGFLPDIKRILARLPKRKQTLLFSATMPDAIHELAHDILQDPIKIEISRSAPATSVKQVLFPIEPHLKSDLLVHLLNQTNKESVLVFTRTKHSAKKIALKLEKAGFRAASLQGNLSQNKRLSAMKGFRDGSLQILVATDIASRGIDVSSISHVINYDIPDTVETYIHRIGRTGRAAKEGEAFTLITQEDHSEVRAIERVLGRKIEKRQLEDFNYDVEPPKRTIFNAAAHKPIQQRRRQPNTQANYNYRQNDER